MRRTLMLVAATLVALLVLALFPDLQVEEAESQVETVVVTERWSGTDRFITAAVVARESYPLGAETVYLASFQHFADAMVAGQAQPPGPILLGGTVPLHRETCETLDDLNPELIVAIGGEASVPAHNLTSAETCVNISPEDQEMQLVQFVNQERAERGLKELIIDLRFRDEARRWSEHMAREGRLSHGNRPSWCDCELWGENVVGPAIDAAQAHQVLMDSPEHRENILGDWDAIGVGAVVHRERVWFTQQFVRYR